MQFSTILLTALASLAYARPTIKIENLAATTGVAEWSTTLDTTELSSIIDNAASDRSRGVTQWVKTLRATYYYACPGGGRGSHVFEWRATFRLRDRNLIIVGVEGIGRFYEQIKGLDHFSARWEGYNCEYVGAKFCSYVFHGKTVGTLDAEGMTMSLITGGMPAIDNPIVTEMCFDNVPAGTCPAIPPGRAASICVVNHVDVDVLQ